MPTTAPAWFIEEQYLINKAAQASAIAFNGNSNWTAQQIAQAIEAAGMTPFEHFERYGNAENVSPNDYFNVDEYLVSKQAQMNTAAVDGRTDWTLTQVLDRLNASHTSAWDDYTQNGASDGVNASNQFDTDAYLQAKATQLNSTSYDGKTNWTAAEAEAAMKAAGLNPIEHYYLYGQAEGLTLTAVPAADQVTVPDGFNPWTSGGDTPGGDEPGPDVPVNPEPIYLTPELNVINGTDMSDLYIGQEFDGANTLQSGDRITDPSTADHDVLLADVTAGSTFGLLLNSVRPEVHNVETLKFTSQQSTDTMHGVEQVAGIRADRIDGMTELWDANSRASLDVSDVRVLSTKMTIGWQDGDVAHGQGNPDFELHFNNQYLAAEDATTTTTLRLQVMDVNGAHYDDQPLKSNPYDIIRVLYKGEILNLDLKAAQEANPDAYWTGDKANYDTLLQAIRTAIEINPQAAGIEASFGPEFTYDSKTFDWSETGTSIVLTSTDGPLTVSETQGVTGWVASGAVPPDSDLDTDMIPGDDTTCPLLQTNIALDNVGMVNWFDPGVCIPANQQFGDYAGDMVVGGMGEGAWVGLQRFDVTVDRGSWISSLGSTNNALRLVTVENKDWDDADSTTGTSTGTGTHEDADKGNLFVGDGVRLTNSAIRGGSLMFESFRPHDATGAIYRDGMLGDAGYGYIVETTTENGLVKTENINSVTYEPASLPAVTTTPTGGVITYSYVEDAHGILDVKTFNAANMVGKANISAAITDLSSRKYLGDTDQLNYLGEKFAPGGDFDYTFGSNDDTLNMLVNGFVAADNDFTMNINMGAGNNSVHVALVTGTDAATNWIADQRSLANMNIVSAGGDDIVNAFGTGRYNINVGAGNDVVYSDNSGISAQDTTTGGTAADTSALVEGVGAIWIANTTTYDIRVADGEIVPYGNDNNSPWMGTANAGATVPNGQHLTLRAEVTYKGVTGVAELQLNESTRDVYTISQRDVNTAIADAVNGQGSAVLDNGHYWLHGLLSAQEGAGDSLMFISKVDGQIADLSSVFDITLSYGYRDATGWHAVAGDPATDTQYNAGVDFAQLDGSPVDGEDSTATSVVNVINLGTGNDLAVLSTAAGSIESIVIGRYNNGLDTIVNVGSEDRLFVGTGHTVTATDTTVDGEHFINLDSSLYGDLGDIKLIGVDGTDLMAANITDAGNGYFTISA